MEGRISQIRGHLCDECNTARAVLKRPKNSSHLCKECFYALFESEIHETIVENALFRPGQRVAIAASGGKGRKQGAQSVVFYAHCNQEVR